MKRISLILTLCLLLVSPTNALPYSLEYLRLAEAQESGTKFLSRGNFDTWSTRTIKESGIIGGKTVTLYDIGGPWGTSNVWAKVSGVTKTNVSVYKDSHPGHGNCAKLYTHIVECKVLGLINIKVLAAGSIYLGKTQEPIRDTKNPMSKLDAGIPFTARPKALVFDYKVHLTGEPNRIRQNGLGKGSKVAGRDYADCILYLQKRWEDAKGNIYAKRVGTLVHRFTKSSEWKESQYFSISYGDISSQKYYNEAWALTAGDNTKFAKNSKGKMVAVKEVGWAAANEQPTHLVLQFDSSHGGAYIGSVGNTLWIDNVRLAY